MLIHVYIYIYTSLGNPNFYVGFQNTGGNRCLYESFHDTLGNQCFYEGFPNTLGNQCCYAGFIYVIENIQIGYISYTSDLHIISSSKMNTFFEKWKLMICLVSVCPCPLNCLSTLFGNTPD